MSTKCVFRPKVGHPFHSKLGHWFRSKVGHPFQRKVGHWFHSKVGHFFYSFEKGEKKKGSSLRLTHVETPNKKNAHQNIPIERFIINSAIFGENFLHHWLPLLISNPLQCPDQIFKVTPFPCQILVSTGNYAWCNIQLIGQMDDIISTSKTLNNRVVLCRNKEIRRKLISSYFTRVIMTSVIYE